MKSVNNFMLGVMIATTIWIIIINKVFISQNLVTKESKFILENILYKCSEIKK